MQYQQHPHNFNPIQPPQARQTDRSQIQNNNKKPTFYEIVSEIKVQYTGTTTYRRMIEEKTSFKQN